MPVFSVSSAIPRQELALAIVEGEGSVGGLIGKQILPDFPINRRTAHLIKATLADTLGLRHLASDNKYIRAPGTEFERLVAKLGDDVFTVTLRGCEIVVPNEASKDYEGYMDLVEFYSARFGSSFSALSKEYLIAQALFNTTTFGAATNSIATYTAANGTYNAYTAGTGNSFINDVVASTRRLKAKGEPPPYVLAMSGVVAERVRTAVTVAAYVSGVYNPQQQATWTQIKAALREFGVDDVLIGDAYYNTAADGATPSLTQIWSNNFIWVGRKGLAKGVGLPEQPNAESDDGFAGVGVPQLGGVGVNAYWENWAPGGALDTDEINAMDFAGGNYVEVYPELKIDSMIVRVKLSSTPYIGNPRCGDLINPQYS